MARPTITFDNSTGSDTAASGSGGTALSGTGASLASSTTVTLSVDSPDLSGVATDGSACIWVDSSSGRQFSRITAVDNGAKTVTVATTYSVTEGSRNWGIGGQRKTVDNTNSRKLWTADIQAGWTIVLNDNTAAAISSIITTTLDGDTTDGYITVRGASEWITMNQSANAGHFNFNTIVGYWRFEKIKFTNTTGAGLNQPCFTFSAPVLKFTNCIFGDATNKLYRAFVDSNVARINCSDCDFAYCLNQAIRMLNGSTIVLENCYIHDNSDAGIVSSGYVNLEDTIIENNGSYGIWMTSSDIRYIYRIKNCVIDGNSNHGIYADVYLSGIVIIRNNNLSNNSGYGINMVAAQTGNQVDITHNNFYNNSSGARNNITADANDTAFNPQYVDRANADFRSGIRAKYKGYPPITRNIGANQSRTKIQKHIGILVPDRVYRGME